MCVDGKGLLLLNHGKVLHSTKENNMREQLESMAEEKYRLFAASLLPPKTKMLGIRLPKLRALAKQMAKQQRFDWQAPQDAFMEEKMLEGMIIGYADLSFEERCRRVKRFVPKIDNWSVCDSVCVSLKSWVKQDKAKVWKLLEPFLQSDKTYQLRFAVVMMLDFFVDDEYLPQVLARLDAVKHNDYYVKMAVAWAVSVCFAKYPAETMQYLLSCSLDDDTFNKALQKIVESYRVAPELKLKIKAMKRK